MNTEAQKAIFSTLTSHYRMLRTDPSDAYSHGAASALLAVAEQIGMDRERTMRLAKSAAGWPASRIS